jgi:hypothetical protein
LDGNSLLFITLVALFQIALASPSINGYNDAPPTPHRAYSHPRTSPSPSPRPGQHRWNHDHKSRLERLVSENRPAKKMVEVGDELVQKRRVWGSKSRKA